MVSGDNLQSPDLYGLVRMELEQVEENLRRLCLVDSQPIAQLLTHVLGTPGKRLRPAITILAAKFTDRNQTAPILMATAVELLHIATLIHDDTVDVSDVRRGKITVNSKWGRKVAVLLGDYVFASSATVVCDTNDVRVIRLFSETIVHLSDGELVEVFDSFNKQQSWESYLYRIDKKTASLFSTAAESGAILSGAPSEWVDALSSYGYNLGMAFQIVDDILDFQGDPNEVGKPVGKDLRQGLVTIPALMLLDRFPSDNPIEPLLNGIDTEQNLRRALEMIQNSDIIPMAYSMAADYCAKAAHSLGILPPVVARQSLMQFTKYVTERRF